MTNMPPPLFELILKSRYIYEKCEALQKEKMYSHDLWFNAIGILNSIYSILEFMKGFQKVTNDDSILKNEFKKWRKNNIDKMDTLIVSVRNKATHQAVTRTHTEVIWETDYENDTIRPDIISIINISGSNINILPSSDFFSHCSIAAKYLRDGIVSIARNYMDNGGDGSAIWHGEKTKADMYAFIDDFDSQGVGELNDDF